jgi:hypothetical protein
MRALSAMAMSSRASRTGTKPASPGAIAGHAAGLADNDLGHCAITAAPAAWATFFPLSPVTAMSGKKEGDVGDVLEAGSTLSCRPSFRGAHANRHSGALIQQR